MADVIVFSSTFVITLGVARSLGIAGYGVKLLALNRNVASIVGKSKYVQQVCQVEMNFDDILRALEVLRGDNEHILIIPLQDTTCKILDEHADQLHEHYIIPLLHDNRFRMTQFMDKMLQKQIAHQCGLLTAEGKSYATNEEGIQSALGEVSYPCFQKPLASANSSSGKLCFAKCTCPEELQHAMLNARNRGCETVLIEEFLTIEKELTVYGVAMNGQVYIPACLDALRVIKGVAAEGMILSTKCIGQTKQKLETFVEKSGLAGLFCIDLIQSKGQLFFSEMNMRSGGSGYAVTLAGANLPGALADMVYKQSSNGPMDIKRDVWFLNEYIELQAYIGGNITSKEYNLHMNGQQERFIYSKEDPKPWRQYYWRVVFKNKIKKRIGLR